MRILRLFSILLMVTGIIGFFGALVCTLLAYRIPEWLELPLGDVGSITVDSSGRIYCSSQGYMRIQVYGKDGRFLRGWACPYKIPILLVDEKDRLHVIHYDEQTVYDRSGRILERGVPVQEGESRCGRSLVYRTKSGWIYEAKTPNLWPRVVRTSPKGETTAIVTTPLYLWMVAGPLPGWLRIALGSLILKVMERRRK